MRQEATPILEPATGIFVMENHDEAYRVWRDAGVRQKILVHIDAHDDLVWTPDQGPINIANFICPALKEDMVREVFWVVPDQTWEDARSRKHLVRRLRKILAKYPGQPPSLKIGKDLITGAILGRPWSRGATPRCSTPETTCRPG
jgi:hypothetical protein